MEAVVHFRSSVFWVLHSYARTAPRHLSGFSVLSYIGRRQAYRSGDASRATDDTALQSLVANAGALLYRDVVWSRKEIGGGLDGDQLQGGIGT